jgi:hypothetical protein
VTWRAQTVPGILEQGKDLAVGGRERLAAGVAFLDDLQKRPPE